MSKQQLSTNTFTASTWIVNSNLALATHSTLAGALASASSGDTILLQTSVTENVTLVAGVNIVGYAGADLTPNVSITGKCTFTGAGTVTLQNIELITNSDYFLAVTGSAASIVNLRNCYLNCSNNTGINYTSSSASSAINLYQCTGNLGTTGIGVYSMSSTGTLEIFNCVFTNSGSSLTANSNSAGAVGINWSDFGNPCSSSSTGQLIIIYSGITGTGNQTATTFGGSGGSNGYYSTFSSGTASAISTSVGVTAGLYNCAISSTNTNALTGSGHITPYNTVYINTSHQDNTTTSTGAAAWGLTQGTAPNAGAIGEQIRSFVPFASAVSLSNNTQKNITSISLTPGIWDLSSNVGFSVASTTTVTALQSSMSTTSNTVTSNFNDDMAQWSSTTGIAGFSTSLCVSGFRVTISTTTTYYLVALALFGVSTVSALGRISATRVG